MQTETRKTTLTLTPVVWEFRCRMSQPCLGCQCLRCTEEPGWHGSGYEKTGHFWSTARSVSSGHCLHSSTLRWTDSPVCDKNKRKPISQIGSGNKSMLLLTICFSEYLLEESRLTASMWPKSMSWPNRNINSSLHTYFFFWYPSSVLSPLNLLRMFASSLLMRLISASLLLPVHQADSGVRSQEVRFRVSDTQSESESDLQFRMSLMKTASPRIPSPLTAGMMMIAGKWCPGHNRNTSQKEETRE